MNINIQHSDNHHILINQIWIQVSKVYQLDGRIKKSFPGKVAPPAGPGFRIDPLYPLHVVKGATCLPWVATRRRRRGDPGS